MLLVITLVVVCVIAVIRCECVRVYDSVLFLYDRRDLAKFRYIKKEKKDVEDHTTTLPEAVRAKQDRFTAQVIVVHSCIVIRGTERRRLDVWRGNTGGTVG